MSFARVFYPASGTDYAIPFPYQSTTEIGVYVAGVAVTNWSFLNANTIRFTGVPTGEVYIVRQTAKSVSKIVFADNTIFKAGDINIEDTQLLYSIQETLDLANDAIGIDIVDGVTLTARNFRVKNVATPTAPTDAVNKSYVDSAITAAQIPQTPITVLATGVVQVATAAGAINIGNTTSYLVVRQVTPQAVNVNLPTGVASGYIVKIIDDNGVAAAFPLTVVSTNGNIRGNTSYVISDDYASPTFVFNGTTWSVT